MTVVCRVCALPYGVAVPDAGDRGWCRVCQRRARRCQWTYLDDQLYDTMRELLDARLRIRELELALETKTAPVCADRRRTPISSLSKDRRCTQEVTKRASRRTSSG